MDYLYKALQEAKIGIKNKDGGQFGAVVVNKEGKIIGVGHNKVLKENDPTSHAEINAIKDACHNLKTCNLIGCTLYTTTEPCPMCLSASIWANIENIYYGTTRYDAAQIGFRDDDIYLYLEGKKPSILNKKQIEDESFKELLSSYNGEMY